MVKRHHFILFHTFSYFLILVHIFIRVHTFSYLFTLFYFLILVLTFSNFLYLSPTFFFTLSLHGYYNLSKSCILKPPKSSSSWGLKSLQNNSEKSGKMLGIRGVPGTVFRILAGGNGVRQNETLDLSSIWRLLDHYIHIRSFKHTIPLHLRPHAEVESLPSPTFSHFHTFSYFLSCFLILSFLLSHPFPYFPQPSHTFSYFQNTQKHSKTLKRYETLWQCAKTFENVWNSVKTCEKVTSSEK